MNEYMDENIKDQIIEKRNISYTVYKSKSKFLTLILWGILYAIMIAIFTFLFKGSLIKNPIIYVFVCIFILILFSYLAFKINRSLLCNKIIENKYEEYSLKFYNNYLTINICKGDYDNTLNNTIETTKILFDDIVFLSKEEGDNSLFILFCKKFEEIYSSINGEEVEITKNSNVFGDMFSIEQDIVSKFKENVPNIKILDSEKDNEEISNLEDIWEGKN